MAIAKKVPAKKAGPRKAAPKAGKMTSAVKDSADKAVNVYLGLIGKGLDMVQENIDSARKDGEKRVSVLERRGVKLRKSLTKRVKGIEVPDTDRLARDAKKQISKAQNQVESAVEDAVDTLKGKQKSAPKRRNTARKAA